MKIDRGLKESIYDLVCGNLRPEAVAAPESRFIADEFTDGSLCAQAYDRMLAAYSRLCGRLGAAEWAACRRGQCVPGAAGIVTRFTRLGIVSLYRRITRMEQLQNS